MGHFGSFKLHKLSIALIQDKIIVKGFCFFFFVKLMVLCFGLNGFKFSTQF